MSEATAHMDLVKAIQEWVSIKFFCGDLGCIYIDGPDSSEQRKPPKLNGFIPDVFAKRDHATVVIGEAKTFSDLENTHTNEQLGAFLTYCHTLPGSCLVLAVPWFMTRRAKSLLGLLQMKCGTSTEVAVIGERETWSNNIFSEPRG